MNGQIKIKKIYCAGPLFNPKEREEMDCIAFTLEKSGYKVFLPHRDGLELAKILPIFRDRGFSEKDASRILNHAIFCLDIYEVIDSDGLVVNMNGRVPDEGAMIEAAVAWSHEKEIVIFNSDCRTLIEGNCNPLVMGLTDFEYVSSYEDIPKIFNQKFKSKSSSSCDNITNSSQKTKQIGKQVSDYLDVNRDPYQLTNLLITLFGEGIWGQTYDTNEIYTSVNTLQ